MRGHVAKGHICHTECSPPAAPAERDTVSSPGPLTTCQMSGLAEGACGGAHAASGRACCYIDTDRSCLGGKPLSAELTRSNVPLAHA
jgi:hypothetical protein